MKKSLASLLFITISLYGFCQSNPAADLQADLLKKSRNQATIGGLLLGGGAALFVAGLAVHPKDYDMFFGTTPEKESKANTAGILLLTGSVSVLGSIPFFVSASKHKRKAIQSVSFRFKMEKTSIARSYSVAPVSYPAVSFGISF